MSYINKIDSGEIVAGKELKQTLYNLKDDIINHKYVYDTAYAEKIISFIETQCKLLDAPFTGKPFILEPFQKAYIESLFSFYMQDEQYGQVRRFRESLLLVGRKNGKSPLAAAIALAVWFCGEAGTNIICASCSYEYSEAVYRCIDGMREINPALAGVTRRAVTGLHFGGKRKSNKKFSSLNHGYIKRMTSKGGGMDSKNLSLAIVDECHEFKDNSLVQALRKSMSTNPNGLLLEITTEGFEVDGYLDKRLTEARACLSGDMDDPRWLIWLYTQDSESEVWQDESSWIKSNPSLGKIKSWSFLRGETDRSRRVPSERPGTLAKDFNVKQAIATAWLSYESTINTETFDISDFGGAWCIGGVDLAETTDLCAAVLLLRKPDDQTVFIYSHFFISKAKANSEKTSGGSDLNPEQIDWYAASDRGEVTIVQGNSVPSSAVGGWFIDIYKTYTIRPHKIGYDSRFSYDFVTTINGYFDPSGKTRLPWVVPQTAQALSSPLRSMEADLIDKNLVYNNSKIFRWCLQNAALITNSRGEVMIGKPRGRHGARIDGAAACLCAYAVYSWCKSDFLGLISM